MRNIICKKCGAEINADLGECPVCGALYYVLPASEIDEPAAEPARENITPVFPPVSDDEFEGDYTRVFSAVRLPEDRPPVKDTHRVPGQPPEPVPPNRPSAKDPRRGSGSGQTPPSRPPKQRRGLGRREGFIVGAVVLLAFLVVLMSAMSGAFDFNRNQTKDMPSVIGLGEGLATSTLEELGLVVNTRQVESAEARGTVVAQSIHKDEKVKIGQSVTLSISEGTSQAAVPERVSVPSLAGYTYEQAQALLRSSGLNILKNPDEYSDVTTGQIIRQEPEAGTEAGRNSYVKVTLSKGPEPVTEYVITVTAGKGGSVSPRGRETVEEGQSATFSITPDEGYEVREVKVDGEDVGAVTTYTFTDVQENHTLYAVFQPLEEEPPEEEPVEENPEEPPEEGSTEEPQATEEMRGSYLA